MGVERKAIQPPLPCFGLEQHSGNPACRGCAHRRDCASLMGDPVPPRTNVDAVRFEFMPHGLALASRRIEGVDPDIALAESVYSFCYKWVFDRKSRSNFKKHQARILERSREARTSLKMFFLTNMLGWRKSHPETAFYPEVLTSEFAVKQVEVFAETCQRRYGAFDIGGLDRLMNSDVEKQDFESQLLSSEIVAGSWIVNFRLFHSGNLIQRLYVERETSLSPYWLCVEPSYMDEVLKSHHDSPDSDCVELVRKLRWNVSQVMGRLKKNSREAVTVFSARERIMPEAVRRVLWQHGLLAEHFQISDLPVVNAIKFWAWLGSAVKHYECLKFVDNNPSIFDKYFGRR